ncbi:unnamed protein product, partial [Meganyctiphanes norvegica]
MAKKVTLIIFLSSPGAFRKKRNIGKKLNILRECSYARGGFNPTNTSQVCDFEHFWNLKGRDGSSRARLGRGRTTWSTISDHLVNFYKFDAIIRLTVGLQNSSSSILVLDEIGKMELFSTGFVSGIRQLLGSPNTTILTTIPIQKGRPIPLVEEIRNRKDILLINLSRENRNDLTLLEQIVETLVSSLGR